MNTKGLLIAIEGIDGCGKSTLAHGLHQYLTQLNYPTLLTKEPGGTPLGKQIRAIVQQQPVPVCPKAEYLLFAADRAQHVHQIIEPALKADNIVISDRMGDSSIVYQGYARGLDIHLIRTVNTWALNKQAPHVTIFLKLDPEIAYERYVKRTKQLSAFEQEGQQFMQKLHGGFCHLYKNRDNVILIEGDQDKETIIDQAFTALTPWLDIYKKNKKTEHENKQHSASPTLARHT